MSCGDRCMCRTPPREQSPIPSYENVRPHAPKQRRTAFRKTMECESPKTSGLITLKRRNFIKLFTLLETEIDLATPYCESNALNCTYDIVTNNVSECDTINEDDYTYSAKVENDLGSSSDQTQVFARAPQFIKTEVIFDLTNDKSETNTCAIVTQKASKTIVGVSNESNAKKIKETFAPEASNIVGHVEVSDIVSEASILQTRELECLAASGTDLPHYGPAYDQMEPETSQGGCGDHNVPHKIVKSSMSRSATDRTIDHSVPHKIVESSISRDATDRTIDHNVPLKIVKSSTSRDAADRTIDHNVPHKIVESSISRDATDRTIDHSVPVKIVQSSTSKDLTDRTIDHNVPLNVVKSSMSRDAADRTNDHNVPLKIVKSSTSRDAADRTIDHSVPLNIVASTTSCQKLKKERNAKTKINSNALDLCKTERPRRNCRKQKEDAHSPAQTEEMKNEPDVNIKRNRRKAAKQTSIDSRLEKTEQMTTVNSAAECRKFVGAHCSIAEKPKRNCRKQKEDVHLAAQTGERKNEPNVTIKRNTKRAAKQTSIDSQLEKTEQMTTVNSAAECRKFVGAHCSIAERPKRNCRKQKEGTHLAAQTEEMKVEPDVNIKRNRRKAAKKTSIDSRLEKTEPLRTANSAANSAAECRKFVGAHCSIADGPTEKPKRNCQKQKEDTHLPAQTEGMKNEPDVNIRRNTKRAAKKTSIDNRLEKTKQMTTVNSAANSAAECRKFVGAHCSIADGPTERPKRNCRKQKEDAHLAAQTEEMKVEPVVNIKRNTKRAAKKTSIDSRLEKTEQMTTVNSAAECRKFVGAHCSIAEKPKRNCRKQKEDAHSPAQTEEMKNEPDVNIKRNTKRAAKKTS